MNDNNCQKGYPRTLQLYGDSPEDTHVVIEDDLWGSIRDEICKLQNLADKVPEIVTDCGERPGGPGYGWEAFKPGDGPSIHEKVRQK